MLSKRGLTSLIMSFVVIHVLVFLNFNFFYIYLLLNTVDPVYSSLGYSEYPAQVNTFCCTDPFTINGIDCN